MDNVNQLGKALRQNKRDVDFVLTRDFPKKPIIHRVRDIFDSEIPFEMEFELEHPDSSSYLSLFFTPPPPSECQGQDVKGCISSICETFITTDTTLDLTYTPLGNVYVFVDGVAYTNFTASGTQVILGASQSGTIKVCYAYRLFDLIPDDLFFDPENNEYVLKNYKNGAYSTGGQVSGQFRRIMTYAAGNLLSDFEGRTLYSVTFPEDATYLTFVYTITLYGGVGGSPAVNPEDNVLHFKWEFRSCFDPGPFTPDKWNPPGQVVISQQEQDSVILSTDQAENTYGPFSFTIATSSVQTYPATGGNVRMFMILVNTSEEGGYTQPVFGGNLVGTEPFDSPSGLHTLDSLAQMLDGDVEIHTTINPCYPTSAVTRYTSQDVGDDSYFYTHNVWVEGVESSPPSPTLPADQEAWGTLDGTKLIEERISGTHPSGASILDFAPHELSPGIVHRSYYENVTMFTRGTGLAQINGFDEWVRYMKFALPSGSEKGVFYFDQMFAQSMAIGSPTNQYDTVTVDIRYAFDLPIGNFIAGHRPFEWGTSLGSRTVNVFEPFGSGSDSGLNSPFQAVFTIPAGKSEIYVWFVQMRDPLGYEHVSGEAATQGGAEIWTIVDSDRTKISSTRELFYLDIYSTT